MNWAQQRECVRRKDSLHTGQARAQSSSAARSGAGAAVLSVVDTIRLTTWTAEGLPTIGGRVRIPLRYVAAEPAAAAK